MRRFLGFLLVVGLMTGAAAGCGSSDDKASDTKTESSADDGGSSSSSGSDSGNADVKAYCDAVDAYVAAVKDAGSDAAKLAELTDQAQELTTKATELATAGLGAEDTQAVADCTKRSSDALLPG